MRTCWPDLPMHFSDGTRSQGDAGVAGGAGVSGGSRGCLGVSRQALSNHLACLRGCGLVVAVPQGRRTRYELADARLGHALTDLLGVVLAVDPAHCAEADEKGCC